MTLDSSGTAQRAGGGGRGRDEDAAVLSVRGHRQHGVAHGEPRRAGPDTPQFVYHGVRHQLIHHIYISSYRITGTHV